MIDEFLIMLKRAELSKDDDGLDKYYNYEVEDDPMTSLELRDNQKPVCQLSRCKKCERFMVLSIAIMIISISRALILPEESKLYIIYAVMIAVSGFSTVISGMAAFWEALTNNGK